MFFMFHTVYAGMYHHRRRRLRHRHRPLRPTPFPWAINLYNQTFPY